MTSDTSKLGGELQTMRTTPQPKKEEDMDRCRRPRSSRPDPEVSLSAFGEWALLVADTVAPQETSLVR